MIHLAAALCTVEQPGEDTHITHLGRTAAGFADILDNNKYAFLDDRGLGVLKDYPIRRIVPELLFALIGLLRCLEVYRVSQIVHALQNAGNGFICPLVRISRRLVAGWQPFGMSISSRIQNLMLFQPLGNLSRSKTVNTEGENLLHNGCGFFIDNPFLFVLLVFDIPVWGNGSQMFTGFSLALPCGADLLGSISGVHFVENIADSGKLILAPGAVNTVIDGNKVYAKLREKNIRIHTHLQIVAPESAHVLYDDALNFASLNISKHTLEARTVEVRSRIAVILVIVPDSGIPVVFAVAFQNLLLIGNTVALTVQLIFLRQAFIQGGYAFFLRIHSVALHIELQNIVTDHAAEFAA